MCCCDLWKVYVTKHRPLYKLIRFWQMGTHLAVPEIRLVGGVPLLTKSASYQTGVVCLILWSLVSP